MDRYEYEDLDRYEDDFIEDDDDVEQEEAPKLSKEELDYLELRQQLKEKRRKELKKETGSANASSRDKRSVLSRDGFGSFFGPSQPVIAQRVIQQSNSLLETASRVNKPIQSERKSSGPSSSAARSQSSGQKPIARNGTLPPKKLEIIKNTRDYSFLLNDDAEVPVPKKVPPPRNISAPRPPEARSSQPSDRSKTPVSNSGRRDYGSHEDKRSTTPLSNRQVRPSMDNRKPSGASNGRSEGRPSVDSRKLGGTSNGRSEGSRPSVDPRNLSSASNRRPEGGRPSVDPRKLSSASNGRPEAGRPSVDARKHPVSSNGRLDDRSVRHDGASNGVARKQVSNSNGGRPVVVTKAPPTRAPAVTSRNSSVIVARPSASKPNPPISRQPVARKDDYVARERPRVTPPAGKPKPSIRPPPPQSRSIARDSRVDERPKKRPIRRDDEDDETRRALMELRKFTGYNPNKYGDDDDDSDMEAGFDDIQKEERRSARAGRLEDEEELRREEEAERRRKLAKKRKLTH